MPCVEPRASSEPGPLTAQLTSVLLISTVREDADLLRPVLEELDIRLLAVRGYREAVSALARDTYAVILCEERLPDGSWKDVLGCIAYLTENPRLVVIASEPRESLYAEVLNLGGWELLVRPIRGEEARRLLDVACDKFAGRRRAARAGMHTAQTAVAG